MIRITICILFDINGIIEHLYLFVRCFIYNLIPDAVRDCNNLTD